MKERVERLEPKPAVQGCITIELLDDDQIVETTRKHNYVNHFTLQGKANLNARRGFGFPIAGRENMAEIIHLTDNDKPINVKDPFVEGEITAWGDVAATAPPSVGARGQFISRMTTPTSQKFVWEFSESQGNGVIRSIYLGPRRSAISSPSTSFDTSFTVTLPFSFHYLIRKNGLFYAADSVRNLYVFEDFVFDQAGTSNPDSMTYETFQLPNFTISDIEVVGEHLYFVNGTSTLRKVNLANPDQVEEEIPLSARDIGLTVAARGLSFSPKRREWYVRHSRLNGDIFVYDEEFQFLRALTLSTVTNTGVGRGLNLSECESHLFFNGLKVDLDRLTRSELNVMNNLAGNLGSYRDEHSWSFTNLSGTSNAPLVTTVFFTAPAEFLSRVRLDDPIFKDGTKKMRITYEYELPPLFEPEE